MFYRHCIHFGEILLHCRVLSPPNGTVLEMQLNEHNKLVLEWIHFLYTGRMYDIVDMSNTATRLHQSGYHPTGHDSVMVDWYPI